MNSQSNTTGSILLRLGLPVLISAAAIYIVLRQVDLRELTAAFSKVSLVTLFKILTYYLIGLFLRAASCYVILEAKLPYWTTFLGMNAGYLLNNILPFRLGEFGRAGLLAGKGKPRVGYMEIFASIVTERILDVFLAALFFLLTLPLVLAEPRLNNFAWAILLIVITLVITLTIASKNKTRIVDIFQKRSSARKTREIKYLNWLENLLSGFSFFLKPGKVAAALLLLAASWFFSMVMLASLNIQLVVGAKWWWGAFVTAASAFASALPSAPAAVGVYEAAVVASYALLGADQSVSLAIALILHAIQFIIPGIFGLLGISILGDRVADLVNKAFQLKAKRG